MRKKMRNATTERKTIPKEDLQRCFQQWKDRWSKCMEAQGPTLKGIRVRNLSGQYGKYEIMDMQKQLRKDFGDIVRVSKIPGRKDMLFLFDPKTAEKMLRNEGIWPIREGIKTLHYYRTVLRKEKYEGVLGTITRMRDLRDENMELPAGFINELYKWSLESIALVALDTRLGCLAPNLAPDSEPQRMIDAVQVMFEGFYKLDLQPSLWRLVSTPMWRRLVHAFDYFYDVAEKYVDEAVAKQKTNPDKEPSILERLMKEDPRVAKVMASDMLFGGVDTVRQLIKYHFPLMHNREDYNTEITKFLLPKNAHKLHYVALTHNDRLHFHWCVLKGPAILLCLIIFLLLPLDLQTSHLAASLLFHLAKYPNVQRKVGEEVRRVLPAKRSPVTEDAMEQMTYLKACLKESLRVFPIAMGNIRETQKDIVLSDYQVPKGVDVFLCHMVMSQDEQHYPRPMAFEPERWLRGGPQAHTAHPFTTMPFGFGPRTCVGRRFAELEVLTLVAKVLRNFWVEYHHGDQIEFSSRSINTVTLPLKFRLVDHE
ncbi:probable cytochrome P450 49a1 [Gryllus bimaculatus]|nr:probable cytochrome P450 49a1 [Gryllus bimaculatus]